jgi:hypothetical protein
VGPVSTCGRELLRGWWRPIGLMVSFMIFTASVRKIVDTPLYYPEVICIRVEYISTGTQVTLVHWPFPVLCATVCWSVQHPAL